MAVLTGTHPAIVAGVPETIGCHFWTRAVLDLTGAENWAQSRYKPFGGSR